MHRFLVPSDSISDKYVEIKEAGLIHQLERVLRVKRGQRVAVFTGEDRYEHLCEVAFVSKQKVNLHRLRRRAVATESQTEVYLYQSLIKSQERLEYAIEKAVELGVRHIVPLITERTERHRLGKRQRIANIIREATEQCGRMILPKLGEAVHYTELLTMPGDNVLGHLDAEKSAAEVEISAERLNVFVGPEGGFTDVEVELARQHGFTLVSTGRTTLRSETAGVALLAQLKFK